jgi:archaellum component FlaC
MDNIEQRISVLESWRIGVDVTLGKSEVHRDNVEQQLSDIKMEIKEFKETVKKLNFTIWGAVIVIFVKFALSGGLANFTNII